MFDLDAMERVDARLAALPMRSEMFRSETPAEMFRSETPCANRCPDCDRGGACARTPELRA